MPFVALGAANKLQISTVFVCICSLGMLLRVLIPFMFPSSFRTFFTSSNGIFQNSKTEPPTSNVIAYVTS